MESVDIRKKHFSTNYILKAIFQIVIFSPLPGKKCWHYHAAINNIDAQMMLHFSQAMEYH